MIEYGTTGRAPIERKTFRSVHPNSLRSTRLTLPSLVVTSFALLIAPAAGHANVAQTIRMGCQIAAPLPVQASPFESPNVGVSSLISRAILDNEDFENAESFEIDSDGTGSNRGSLREGETTTALKFEASATGMATIQLRATGSGFDTVLSVFDSRRRQIATNDDYGDLGTDSQVEIRVNEGEEYYVQVASYDDQGGRFTVNVEIDEGADPLNDATPIELDDDGDGEQTGQLRRQNDKKLYRIDSPFDGSMVISLSSPGEEFDTFLRVYDSDYRVVNFNDDGGGGGTNSQVTIRAEEGQAYFIEATAYDESTGRFDISIEGRPGDDPLETAVEMEFNDQDKSKAAGNLAALGENDYFKFVAPVDGQMTIVMLADNTDELDTFLAVFDDRFRIIDTNDDAFDENTNSAITFYAEAGATYYGRASAYSSSTGGYTLQVVPGGMPSPFDDAVVLEVNAAGRTAKRGELGGLASSSYFIYESKAYSNVTVNMVKGMASDIDPVLTLYDADKTQIAYNDDSDDGTDSRLVFRARPGQTYYLEASSVENIDGTFLLTVRVDEALDPLDAPSEINFEADDTATVEGRLDVTLGEQGYRFESPVDGKLTIINRARGDFLIDPVLRVYDEDKELIGENDDAFNENSDAALTINADKGSTYYVVTYAYGEGRGQYEITIAPGGIPSPFEGAKVIELNDEGRGSATGRIAEEGSSDYFQFVAPEDGEYTVVQRTSGGAIDTLLYLYDEDEDLVEESDDAFPDNTDSAITFDADEGETFYFQASAYEGSAGEYVLEVSVGGLPSPLDDAKAVEFEDGESTLKIAGDIEFGGEIDVYQFDAPLTGRVVITQRAGAASDLDSTLTVYDGDKEEIAMNDDGFDDSLDSKVTIRVREGDSYYVAAAALDTGTGSYELKLVAEEVADPFESAKALEIDADGNGEIEGEIKDSSEPVIFVIKPEADMTVIISLEATGGSDLDTYLTLLDSDQDAIAENDDASDFTVDSELTVDLEGGETYYIQASAYGTDVGDFKLSVEIE